MADYIGTQSGNYSSGYLIANGNVYPAVSGAGNRLDIPAGNYKYSGPDQVRADEPTMTDGTGRKKFKKFHVIGTGPSGEIPDKRMGKKQGGMRIGIDLHYDGGNPGTAGCIGYQDTAAQQALIDDPNKSVSVQYVDSDAAVKAEVERRLGHKVDWSKVKAPKKPGSGGGTRTKTKKGHQIKKAHHKVLVGPKHRQLVHKQAELEGGGQVAEGNPTVFVGEERYQVARVDHMTTDGSPLADGEETVLLS